MKSSPTKPRSFGHTKNPQYCLLKIMVRAVVILRFCNKKINYVQLKLYFLNLSSKIVGLYPSSTILKNNCIFE